MARGGGFAISIREATPADKGIKKLKKKLKSGEVRIVHISMACMHCDNAPCVEVCPVKATTKTEEGPVVMDYEKCIGCGQCQKICAHSAITIADKRASIDAIISDAEERGIPCRITGLNAKAVEEIEEFYPGKFHFHYARNSFDYVYSTSMAGIRDTMRGIISQKNAPVASSAKSWERQVQSAIRSQEKAFDRLLNSGN